MGQSAKLLIALMVGAMCSLGTASAEAVYGSAKITVHSNYVLKPNQQRRFNTFKAKNNVFYSALFVNTKADFWFAMIDEHSLEDVQFQGMAGCRMVSPANAANDCILYASASPAGRAIVQVPLQSSISASLSKEIPKALKRANPGTFMAVAINHVGAWGLVWNNQTEALAKEHALKECDIMTKDPHRMSFYADQLIKAIKAKNGFKCRVVSVVRVQ